LSIRLPDRPVRQHRRRGCLSLVSNIAATISNLRVDGQAITCSISVTGDPGGLGEAYMMVYDAAGTEQQRSELGSIAAGQTWDAHLDLPHGLADGDYGAWVHVLTQDANGTYGQTAEEGVSFLVGRGQIFPSREQADKPSTADPPKISALRLEGSWLVFDMTNAEHFDIEVTHKYSIGVVDSGSFQTFHGQELLRAGHTQQAHYLLPDQLADGRYLIVVEVSVEGSMAMAPEIAEIQVNGGVMTMVPLS
jgi:hypothetical protein